jgi:DNA-binding transcriptional LysR family regulator
MNAVGLPDPIDLRSWRQFLAVAESLHFGRAAQRLHITQPPLTQGIQKLEAQLGYALFERSRRRVELTAAGRALVDPVRHLLRSAEQLSELGRAAADGEVGTLRLGFVSTVGFDPLPRWLRAYRQSHPRVKVQLREATGDTQLQAIASGDLDAGFMVHAPHVIPTASTGLKRLSVGVEPLYLALPKRLAPASGTLDIASVLRAPLVIFPRPAAPSLYDSIIAFCHDRGVAPVIGQEAIQMQTIVNLVSGELGVAFVPRVVTKLRRSGVVYRPLPRSRGAGPRAETCLVWQPDSPPLVQRFAERVKALSTGKR